MVIKRLRKQYRGALQQYDDCTVAFGRFSHIIHQGPKHGWDADDHVVLWKNLPRRTAVQEFGEAICNEMDNIGTRVWQEFCGNLWPGEIVVSANAKVFNLPHLTICMLHDVNAANTGNDMVHVLKELSVSKNLVVLTPFNIFENVQEISTSVQQVAKSVLKWRLKEANRNVTIISPATASERLRLFNPGKQDENIVQLSIGPFQLLNTIELAPKKPYFFSGIAVEQEQVFAMPTLSSVHYANEKQKYNSQELSMQKLPKLLVL